MLSIGWMASGRGGQLILGWSRGLGLVTWSWTGHVRGGFFSGSRFARLISMGW